MVTDFPKKKHQFSKVAKRVESWKTERMLDLRIICDTKHPFQKGWIGTLKNEKNVGTLKIGLGEKAGGTRLISWCVDIDGNE